MAKKQKQVTFMSNYTAFAKFYDRMMGDRSATVSLVQKLIKKHNPEAKKVLEIACGTGTILESLEEDYQVYGLDISEPMLEMAKRKVPKAELFQQDMRNFQLDQKFDVILCLYDSINHLLEFSEWEKVFQKTTQHLNKGGLFIFDVNTQGKLKRLARQKPIIKQVNKDYVIMDIIEEDDEIFNWHLKIFEHQDKNNYKVFTENIKEKSFSVKTIKQSLKNHFSHIETFSQKQERSLQQAERVYFICKK